MDALDAINNRIDQLVITLGVTDVDSGLRGDSIAANLLTAARCMCAATAGQEKLTAASQRSSELNSYTDPGYVEKMQGSEAHAAFVVSAASLLQHHCHCMQLCKQTAHVLSSDALKTAAALEPELQRLKKQVHYDQQVVDEISQGISNVVSQCGDAASIANESVATVAKKMDNITVLAKAASQPAVIKRKNGPD